MLRFVRIGLVLATVLITASAVGAADHGDHSSEAEPSRASPPSQASPNWMELASVEEIEVITHDEDGEVRETTIWLAVVDGDGFVRTGGSSWGQNLQRDPSLVLRIEGEEYPLRAEFVEDDGLRGRITDVFREKYGFSDWLITPIRGSRPMIMRMLPPGS